MMKVISEYGGIPNTTSVGGVFYLMTASDGQIFTRLKRNIIQRN